MLNIHVCYAAEFKIIAVNKKTGKERVAADWFQNTITDNGLNAIGQGRTYMSQCYLGTGSTTPTFADNQMDTLLTRANYIFSATTHGANPTTPYFGWSQYQYFFPVGTATGNLTEIGVGWQVAYPDPAYLLFSRTLIKNSGGTPIAVTILEDEGVKVLYKVKQYAPVGDNNYVVNISGVDYTFTTRAAATLSASAWQPRTHSGTAVIARVNNGSLEHPEADWTIGTDADSLSFSPYVLDSFERTLNAVWESGTANAFSGGIKRTVCMSSYGAYQSAISPSIPKLSPLELGLSYKFTWSRHV